MEILTGNFNKENNSQSKGWVIGSFIETPSFFHSDEFEVKWAEHKKGDIKPGLVTNVSAKTLVILISGKYKVTFTDKINNNTEEKTLNTIGDYLSYDAINYSHIGEAIEDCLLIAIRWPSKR